MIHSALQSEDAKRFNWTGFQQMWKVPDVEKPQQVFSEAWTTDCFAELEEEIRCSVPAACELEPIVIALKVYSDSTQPTSFGNHTLWPVYLWIMLQSKYERSKLMSFSAHHFMYIPKVSVSNYYFMFL